MGGPICLVHQIDWLRLLTSVVVLKSLMVSKSFLVVSMLILQFSTLFSCEPPTQ